jgi:hypothetical protein
MGRTGIICNRCQPRELARLGEHHIGIGPCGQSRKVELNGVRRKGGQSLSRGVSKVAKDWEAY